MTFRTRSLKAVAALALSSALAFSACSKDDAKSTDAATTTEATSDTAAATEAATETAAATEAAADSAAATEAASTAATATEAADTVAASATEAAAAGADAGLGGLMVTQMLSAMTGGGTPDPADVKCVSEKVDDDALAAVIQGAGSGATPDANAMLPIIKSVFQCKPKGLVDSFTKDSFGELNEVSADEKVCIGNAILDAIGNSDSILKAMVADASAPPAEFKDSARKAATDCVKDEGIRAKVIEQLNKNS